MGRTGDEFQGSTSLHRLLMAVLPEKITCIIRFAEIRALLMVVFIELLLLRLLMLTFLLTLFPENSPCVGIT